MLASLFKFFPFVWPFLKETLLGGRNHPLFTNRRRSKFVKVLVGILIALTVSSVDAYLTVSKENEALRKELQSQIDKKVTEDNVRLMICDNDLKILRGHVAKLQADVASGDLSCKQAKDELDQIEKDSHNRIPSTIKETISTRAQRKLDEIEE